MRLVVKPAAFAFLPRFSLVIYGMEGTSKYVITFEKEELLI